MSLIVIDIKDIKSLEDIEKFFILLYKAGVLFHPEMSFHDFIHTDENRNTIGPSFSEEESERLDQLMKKCKDLVDELETDIWEICKRADEKVLGKLPLKKK
jgi:hypothetical protein